MNYAEISEILVGSWNCMLAEAINLSVSGSSHPAS